MEKIEGSSLLPMSKFIPQLLRHKEVGREEDAGVPCDRIVGKCKEALSEDSRFGQAK